MDRPSPSPRSGVAEPTGAGSRGASRVPAALASRSHLIGGDRHLNNHTDAAKSRSSRCAIAKRGASPAPRAGGALAGRTGRREDISSTVQSLVGAPPFGGRWRDRLGLFGLLVDGLTRLTGLRSFLVADHVRAGMEVMSPRRTNSEPAASVPAGVHPTRCALDRADPRRSIGGSVPRLPSPARFRSHVRRSTTQGDFRCRRWKHRPRPRSSTA
jgi:hypothetical protein